MRRSEHTSAARLGGGGGGLDTAGLFQFRLVDRLQCQQSGTVKYAAQAADNLLSLQVMNECALFYACGTTCCAGRNLCCVTIYCCAVAYLCFLWF